VLLTFIDDRILGPLVVNSLNVTFTGQNRRSPSHPISIQDVLKGFYNSEILVGLDATMKQVVESVMSVWS